MQIESSGQEFTNITRDNPAEVLIFVAIGWNGEHWSFVNALQNRRDFFPHWNKIKSLLKPYTFHCIRVKGWNTNSLTGQTFETMDHIAEFSSIAQARAMNAAYLRLWSNWVDVSSDAETITAGTTEFVQKLFKFDKIRQESLNRFNSEIDSFFSNAKYIADLEFVIATHETPDQPYIIDDEPFWMEGFISDTEDLL